METASESRFIRLNFTAVYYGLFETNTSILLPQREPDGPAGLPSKLLKSRGC